MLDALEIGYAVKDRRALLGLTQAQVAEAAGVSKRCLWSIELGRNPGVQLDKLIAVLRVLGLDLKIIDSGAQVDVTRSREDEKGGVEQRVPEAPAARRGATSAADGIDALAILTGRDE